LTSFLEGAERGMRSAELKETGPAADWNAPGAAIPQPQTETHGSHSTDSPLILFDHVSKWYGSVLALNQVTLELTGGITGLVGANGAGKSTLLRLATGQLKPTLGSVTIRGVDAWDWRARRLIGYCPDVDAFYEDLSGRKFVSLMARLCGYDRREAAERTEAVLERVGMIDRADRKVQGYSKGMRQRIKLAQALLHDPELLILDEPLAGIDPIGRQELLELFQQLAAQGKCLLISSHELEALEKLTNHVAIMARGRVAAVGTLQQIRELLDDYPVSIRIEVQQAREVGRLLMSLPEVIGAEIEAEAVVVTARNPKRFFAVLGQLVVQEKLEFLSLEPLDESAHAILGYLLGGSGRT
jgi:ABC-2 type transport system ATP-binding protein